jgi:proline iminopeptidase
MEMRVAVEGAEIHVVTRGAGLPCLVLSSIGTRPFEKQLPAELDRSLQLCFVDLRGSGRSTGEASALDFDVLAQDLEAVRRAIGAERVLVFGHSILGALAVEYARRCPRSVSHLILVGTPPSGDMERLVAAASAFFEQDASPDRKQQLAKNLASLPPDPRQISTEQMLLSQTPKRFSDPRFDAAPYFAEAEVNRDFFMHLMGKLTAAWQLPADALALPTLLALGRHDYVLPHFSWDGVLDRYPRVTRQLFEHSGHQPFLEEPERFCSVVNAWLAGQ